MKEKLTLFISCILLASSIFAGTITITRPRNGEILFKDVEISIKWTETGITNPVKVSLWQNGQRKGIIAQNISPGTLTCRWKVGTYKGLIGESLTGDGFIIKVKEQGSSGALGKNERAFSIKVWQNPTIDPGTLNTLRNSWSATWDLDLTEIYESNGVLRAKVRNGSNNQINQEVIFYILNNGVTRDGLLQKPIKVNQGQGTTRDYPLKNLRNYLRRRGYTELKVTVDGNNQIKETDENNNSKTKSFNLNPVYDLAFDEKSFVFVRKDRAEDYLSREGYYIEVEAHIKIIEYSKGIDNKASPMLRVPIRLSVIQQSGGDWNRWLHHEDMHTNPIHILEGATRIVRLKSTFNLRKNIWGIVRAYATIDHHKTFFDTNRDNNTTITEYPKFGVDFTVENKIK
jgi:hypothetical protein